MNLLDGTSSSLKTASGAGWDIGLPESIKIADKNLIKGKSYTYSVWIQDCDVDARAVIYIYGKGATSYTGNVITAGRSGFSTVTFTISDDVNNYKPSVGFTESQVSIRSFKYSNMKLEEGSTVTPWLPSFSEVTASDYPSYIGTYTDNDSSKQSTDPLKYTWKKIVE